MFVDTVMLLFFILWKVNIFATCRFEIMAVLKRPWPFQNHGQVLNW